MKRWVTITVRVVVTVLVTWFILERLGVQWNDAAALDWTGWRPRWGLLVGSVLVLVSAFLGSAWNWSRVVVDLGGPGLGLRDAGRMLFVSNLGRYVPGKVWQVAGLAWMAAQRGVPAAIATVAALVGTGVGVAAAGLVGVPAIVRAGGAIAPILLAGAAMVVVCILFLPGAFRWGVNTGLRLGRGGHQLAQGNLHGPRWLSLYVVNWLGYAGAFAIFVTASGFEIPALLGGSAFAAAYLVGYLAFFAPAGAGVREAGLVAFLAGVAPPAEALALAVAGRIWITAVELIVALVFLVGGGASSGATEGEGGDERS